MGVTLSLIRMMLRLLVELFVIGEIASLLRGKWFRGETIGIICYGWWEGGWTGWGREEMLLLLMMMLLLFKLLECFTTSTQSTGMQKVSLINRDVHVLSQCHPPTQSGRRRKLYVFICPLFPAECTPLSFRSHHIQFPVQKCISAHHSIRYTDVHTYTPPPKPATSYILSG